MASVMTACAPAPSALSQPRVTAIERDDRVAGKTGARVRVDAVRVEKSRRRLVLLWRGAEVRTYHVSLGSAPIGPKRQEGDGKTPEGRYTLDSRNTKSAFHLSLHVSYPNAADRAQARARGVSPGGDIFVHGTPNGSGARGALLANLDWTAGCIAVTDDAIDEIGSLVRDGTPIEIVP